MGGLLKGKDLNFVFGSRPKTPIEKKILGEKWKREREVRARGGRGEEGREREI